MKISYSFGMVDLIHYGHIVALKKASKYSDISIFGLVSDEASDALYGVHVSNEKERRSVIESIKFIDKVIPQLTFDPTDNLKKIHEKYPDAEITLYHGNEWGVMSAKKYIESIGGHAVKIDYYDRLSPQKILDTLNKKEVENSYINNNLISTKANTLLALKELVKKSVIEDIFVITYNDLKNNLDNVLNNIKTKFKGKKIVVRSSSKREDAFQESNAGHFTSVLNVNSSNLNDIKNAINKVIKSYGDDAEKDEQILIQTQTNNVLMSGVIFTRDIQKNRPYYVINYDVSGSTDSVTSGAGGKSAWISYTINKNNIPKKWKKLMDAVNEIENIFKGILLDIEFAVTESSIVIFQVRPLAAAYKFGRKNDIDKIEEAKKIAILQYNKLLKEKMAYYSDMAFWNPAEIIGDNPKNLDYSLYREIITKIAWNSGLVPLGYRSIPHELMFRFGNKPYINLERSFEALMPASISNSLANKLKNSYLKKLKNDLSAHDKIEFEISHNCYDFSMHKRMKELRNDGFSNEEISELEEALKHITIENINNYPKYLNDDIEDLRKLEVIRLDIQNNIKGSNDYKLIAKSIHILLDSIEKFGTPQFSRHARCAFIAKSICKSLVNEGYITSNEFNQFMSSIHTIAVEYDKEYHDVQKGNLKIEQFKSKYGHLRAGTYNIRSPRYDQIDNLIAQGEKSNQKIEKCNNNKNIDKVLCDAINKALEKAKIKNLCGKDVIYFIKQSIEQREYFKFIFTKTLSYAIELIKQIGNSLGFETKDLSYLEVSEIYALEFYSDVEQMKKFWNLVINQRKYNYKINSSLILPEVISSKTDFDCIELIDSRPNFITESRVTNNVIVLDDDIVESSIEGKIVVIEKADPGYDWIFSKGICGLVTKYGGAASHMAIRCAEFKIPAAIGSGAKLFDYVINSEVITIDCKNEKIIREK